MKLIFVFMSVMLIEIGLQSGLIRVLNRREVTLAQKVYGVKSRLQTKSSTPSMGGVVFVAAALFSIPASAGLSVSALKETALFWILPVLSGLIGFADDWIKFRRDSSEGFPSLYKLTAQFVIVLPWAAWIASTRGISLWPGFPLSTGTGTILGAFMAVGMLNAVNVTDGLDGLAAGTAVISIVGALVWLPLEGPLFYALLSGLALCAGFMWHNAYPARIFMGDVGSHFIAGLIVSGAIWGNFLIALIPLGFLYGLEILSVAIQLTAIYGFRKKVFLMSPVHHHFELMGWSENHIVARFWLIHGVGLTLCSVFISSFLGIETF
ncbi:MAG: phospho-N-acetylmuramoyl-pentapeptide-transferase [Aminivibrio sp.]